MLEPYLDSGAMMTSYVAPIMRGGKRVGVAGVDVALSSLDTRIEGRQGAGLRLRVRRGRHRPARRLPARTRAGPASERRGRRKKRNVPGLAGIPAAAQAGRSGHLETVDPVTGKPAILFYAPVQDRRLELRRGRAEGRGARRRQPAAHTLILVGLLALLLVGAALVLLIASRLSRPVREVAAPPSGSPRATSTSPSRTASRGRDRPHGQRVPRDGRLAAREGRASPRRSPTAT